MKRGNGIGLTGHSDELAHGFMFPQGLDGNIVVSGRVKRRGNFMGQNEENSVPGLSEVSSRFDPISTSQLTIVRAIVRLLEKWNVGDQVAVKLLGHLHPDAWHAWKSGDVDHLSDHQERRIHLFLDIHTNLRRLFNNPENDENWIKQPHGDFGDVSPLAYMASGDIEHIEEVRSYLKASLLN